MVSKKKALIASGVSALIVGASHYLAHTLSAGTAIAEQINIAGLTVVVVTFAVAYFGMNPK